MSKEISKDNDNHALLAGVSGSTEKLFTKILVEIKGGVMVNITDLPKEQYEYFLDLMLQIRTAYIAVTDKR